MKLRSRSSVFKIGMLLIAVMLLTSMMSALSVFLGGAPSDNVARTAQRANNPPSFYGTPQAEWSGSAGEEIYFSFRIRDRDNDTINVTWSWGDGTPDDHNKTDEPWTTVFQYVSQTHVYNPPREPGMGNYNVNYTLRLTLDDGNGSVVLRDFGVNVTIPDNIAPEVRIVQPTLKFDPSDAVQIVANATDYEGEELNWTFVYNGTVDDVFIGFFTTPASAPGTTVWQNVSCVFGAPGNYSVKVFVTDRVGDNQYDPSHNITGGPITIEVVLNSLPSVADNISMTSSDPVIIDSVLGYVNVTYSITARDRDGEVLNVTWDFDDGTPKVYNESAGTPVLYEFFQWRNYSVTGQFNVTVNVTDGRLGHNVVRYLVVNVTSTNLPPGVVGLQYNLTEGVYAVPNEVVNFTLVLTDPEQNPLEVVVDFGDDSPKLFFNLTAFVDGNVTLEFSHSYAKTGIFNLTITYTDNRVGLFNHSKVINVPIKVDIPPVVVDTSWSWWDYTSLGLFCLIPVSAAVRMMMISRTRRRLEEQGYTLEEWRLIQSEMPEEKTKTGGT